MHIICMYVIFYNISHALLFLQAHTYVPLKLVLSTCMHVRMFVCMHVCMYVCMYVRTYVHTYVCMYVCVYVCMYACMHVCTSPYCKSLRTDNCVWHMSPVTYQSPACGMYVRTYIRVCPLSPVVCSVGNESCYIGGLT